MASRMAVPSVRNGRSWSSRARAATSSKGETFGVQYAMSGWSNSSGIAARDRLRPVTEDESLPRELEPSGKGRRSAAHSGEPHWPVQDEAGTRGGGKDPPALSRDFETLAEVAFASTAAGTR